jgi:hypothetical protein
MYAHRTIQRLGNLHVQFDLPPEFADCTEVEIKQLDIIYQQKISDLNELKKPILQKAFSDQLSWIVSRG